MKRILNKFSGNPFLVNIMTLMSGTALSQVILFMATPLLTRIFTPAEFGVFALYTAIVGTITTVAAWKYEPAIILPEKESDAVSLTWLSVFACFTSSLVVLLIILIFGKTFAGWVGGDFNSFMWIIPAGILFSGLYQVFISFGTRHRRFFHVSGSRVLQALGVTGTQAGLKLATTISPGLIWGKVSGDFLSAVFLFINFFRKGLFGKEKPNIADIRKNAATYSNFPRYQSFATFLNALSQNLPAIMLTAMYNPAIAGYYALTARVLSQPARLVGKSTREVYYQKASEMHARGESIHKIFFTTTFGLAKAGFIPFIILAFISVWLFKFLFGPEWDISGEYARIIIPWSFLSFINSPAAMTIYILGLQRFSLKFESLMFVLRFLSLYVSYIVFENHYYSIIAFAAVGVIFNIILISYSYKNALKTKKED